MADDLIRGLNALIENMDSGRATAREAIAAAAVENELLSHAELLIDRNNQVRERLASKLTSYTALPRYTEPVDHGPLALRDALDETIEEMEEPMPRVFQNAARPVPPEMRQRPPFQVSDRPGPAPNDAGPFPESAFYRTVRPVRVA